MAIEYQRNTWETGKVITAKALNDIETGIVNIVEKLNDMDGEVASQTLKVEGNASIGGTATVTGEATFNGPVEIKGATTINGATVIKGATTINNDITVGTDNHIILSASPNENNHVVTKGYVDSQISTINNKTINSGNTGIVSNGNLGEGITLTLQHATAEILGGIKVGSNLNIDNQGVLSATDTTYSVASASANGLMSSADFNKLAGIASGATANVGTVTGIQMNGTVQEPSSGIVDLGTIITSHQDISTKANLNSPTFSGVVNFGDQISIDTNDNKITINQTDITEQKINALYNLPSIPPLSSDDPDGTYTLQAQKTGTNITYSWVSVSQQESGGEGS